MKAKKYTIVINIAILLASIIAIVFNNSLYTARMIAFFILCLNLILLFKARKNWETFIIFGFIFWFNYSICISNLLFPINDYFTGWRKDTTVMVPSMNIILVFIVGVFVLIQPMKKQNICFFEKKRSNKIITCGIILILVLILVFGFSRTSAVGARGDSTALYEYSIILFIISFYYTKTVAEKNILSIILVLFVIQDLVYGGRITALQLLICWFLIFWADKMSIKKVLPFVVVMILLFSGIGAYRANFKFNIDSIKIILNSLYKQKLTLDTAYSAFYTSGTFIKVENLISMFDRLKLCIRFVLSLFLGGIVADSNLAAYTRQFYSHYYGGVLPFFGHFYIGYFGVVAIAAYVAALINMFILKGTNAKKKGMYKCLGIYITSTVPRWYLYSPSSIIRGVLIFCVIYYICYTFDFFCRRYRE